MYSLSMYNTCIYLFVKCYILLGFVYMNISLFNPLVLFNEL